MAIHKVSIDTGDGYNTNWGSWQVQMTARQAADTTEWLRGLKAAKVIEAFSVKPYVSPVIPFGQSRDEMTRWLAKNRHG